MVDTFKKLHEEHQGKICDKWSLYLEEWDQLFAPYRDKQINLLEIGIQNGGSLEIWGKYFSKAKKIVGCDIEQKCSLLEYDDARIAVIIGDANSDDCEREILKQASKFDILIDDGSHESRDIIRSFARYFPHLSDDAIYIAEDLHCSYWKPFEGGLHNPYSSIAFFKRLADMVNFEHWRNNKPRKNLLEKFSEHFDIDFDEMDLARIHSVNFINSLCVIKKLSPEKNTLGKRIVIGHEEKVTTGWNKLDKTSISDIAMESGYEANHDVFNLINEVEDLTKVITTKSQKIAALQEHTASLEQIVTERNETIANLNQILVTNTEQISTLNLTIDQYNEELVSLKKSLTQREEQIRRYQESISTYREEILRAFHNTRTWRLTQPLRSAAKIARRFRDKYLRQSQNSAAKALNAPEDSDEFQPHEVDLVISELNDQALMQYLIGSVSKVSHIKHQSGEQGITVIIPVYRGVFETERCIRSVLSSTNVNDFKLLIIDDCSPEPEMKEMLQKLEGSNLEVLRNTKNLGFVKTVNRGMAYAGNSDVILLNSDTIVSNNWVDRLVNQAYSNEAIGTVTPFSNNATICNYPNLDGWLDLPADEGLSQLDLAFSSANLGENVEIPTAVGFCMYIKHDCLNEVGLFDEAAFGKGYGEENDFCLKASEKGWKHILATDTFVFHEGEVSFSTAASAGKATAMDVIRSRYPNYENKIIFHIQQNQAYQYRVAATAARYRLGTKPVAMLITHKLGGGTERHVQELSQFLTENGARVLILRPDSENKVILESFIVEDSLRLGLSTQSLKLLGKALETFGIKKVHVHHTIGFGFSIEELLTLMQIPYDFTTHDYFSICPRIYLIKPNQEYSGIPSLNECNNCLSLAPAPAGASEIYWWRAKFGSLLNGAERVICPSQDAADKIARVYPSAGVVAVPHEEINPPSFPKFGAQKKKRRFAILGALGEQKGLFILEKLLHEIALNEFDIEIILIGYTVSSIRTTKNFFETGSYLEQDLQRLIDEHDPEAILFLAQCPETYSYTLSAAIQSGRPIIAPNLGAFPERVRGITNAHIFPLEFSALDLANYLNSLKFSIEPSVENKVTEAKASINQFYKADDYWKVNGKSNFTPTILLVPEMQQSVPSPCAYIRLIQPLISDNIQKEFKLRVSSLNQVSNICPDIVITNRLPCKELSELEIFLKYVRDTKTKLVYDIDDNLLQLHDNHPEKVYYKSKESIVLRLLNESNCVWTSTEKLATRLQPFCKEILTIENYLDESMFEMKKQNYSSSSRFKILYMGTTSHQRDLAEVLVALRRLKTKGVEFELNLIGITDGRIVEEWIKVITPPVEASSYPNFMRWLKTLDHFDLGIAPLEKSVFNECKSDIKFWDYTAMGVPTLASNIGAYSLAINDGRNGLLADNSADDWVTKLTWAIDNRDQLANLVINATDDLRKLSVERAAEIKRRSSLFKLIDSDSLRTNLDKS